MGLSTYERLPAQVHELVCCSLMYGGQPEPFDVVEWYRRSQDQSIDRHAGVHAVAALSRTCRASHGPAVKIIWRCIPDVALLFHTLPRECYEIKGHEEDRQRLNFEIIRQLEVADLTRFRFYAARVTELGVWAHTYNCNHLPSSAMCYVATRKSLQELGRVATANGWRLFPNVHTLACTDTLLPVCTSPQPSHLLGPQLRKFQFQRHNSPYSRSFEHPHAHVTGEEDIMQMLGVLQLRAPELQKLSIDMADISHPIVAAFYSVVLSCQNPVSLNYGDSHNFHITPAALRHIACLPLLEKLSFSSKDDSFTVEELKAFNQLPRSKTFPRLLHAEIELRDLAVATVFVRHISSPLLRVLDIIIEDGHGVPYKEVFPFFRALRKLPGIPSLHSLGAQFNAYCTEEDKDGPQPISCAMLRPLLASPYMSSFEFRVGCPFRLNDAFLEDMVRAWPRITILRLGEYYPTSLDYTPEVTWNAIITMARGWPRLKELSVAFDADVSRVPPSRLRELRESNRADPAGNALHDMDFMSFMLTKIDDEMAVATILSELFSPLAEAYSCWESQAQEEENDERLRMEEEGDAFVPDPGVEARVALCLTYADRWSSMCDLMEQIILIRRQEENWQSAIQASTG
ncbi:hypothetical protein K466DRAFT_658773 [Polyporus arcularius HHB13444]|uniref:Uncharacterized protein n=1 Tax=Polyporus arcularius HHB13444 TaxID=1314778 RepID=A0A5C3PTH0_9APHY|nr:hypothetical protein K466DRAFT_658773 [Polyporus arcularius HHB13444]